MAAQGPSHRPRPRHPTLGAINRITRERPTSLRKSPFSSRHLRRQTDHGARIVLTRPAAPPITGAGAIGLAAPQHRDFVAINRREPPTDELSISAIRLFSPVEESSSRGGDDHERGHEGDSVEPPASRSALKRPSRPRRCAARQADHRWADPNRPRAPR